MDQFRTRGFIPWSKIDNYLRAFRSIWLSTTRPDGRPHAVPVSYTRRALALSHLGAQATMFEPGSDLYRVNVKRIMA